MVVAMANNGMPVPAQAVQPPASLAASSYVENDHVYHGWHKGKYMFPCGEKEKDRMDIYHKLFLVARNEKLHSTPFVYSPDSKLRILDLGTGTGIWAIDMAFKYHNLNPEIVGIDLSLIQPAKIPPGLTFLQRDIEEPWELGVDSWDLIHMRMLYGSIMNWHETYEKAFQHLRPGTGWIEHVEIDMEPRCDDDTLPSNGAIVDWYRYLMDAMQRVHRPMNYNPNTRRMLEQIGFTDVEEKVIRLPLKPWPNDPHEKDIGRWYSLAVVRGLHPLSMAPFTRTFGWGKDVVDRVVADVEREICSRKIHVYSNLHIWTARRPANA